MPFATFRGTLRSMATPPKLLDRLRGAARARHFSVRKEEAYVMWSRRFILFDGKRHPSAMGADEVNAFLSHLAVELNVSASTQSQALSALLFLGLQAFPWVAGSRSSPPQ